MPQPPKAESRFLGTKPMTDDEGADFWAFALEFYERPGVAEMLLTLQNQAGADVMTLLWLLFGAARGQRVEAGDLDAFEAATGLARAEAARLRLERQALKATGGRAYASAKAEELRAERAVAAAAPAHSTTLPCPSPGLAISNLEIAFCRLSMSDGERREWLNRLSEAAKPD